MAPLIALLQFDEGFCAIGRVRMRADFAAPDTRDDRLDLWKRIQQPFFDPRCRCGGFCQRDRWGHRDPQQNVTFFQRGCKFRPKPRAGEPTCNKKHSSHHNGCHALPDEKASK